MKSIELFFDVMDLIAEGMFIIFLAVLGLFSVLGLLFFFCVLFLSSPAYVMAYTFFIGVCAMSDRIRWDKQQYHSTF